LIAGLLKGKPSPKPPPRRLGEKLRHPVAATWKQMVRSYLCLEFFFSLADKNAEETAKLTEEKEHVTACELSGGGTVS